MRVFNFDKLKLKNYSHSSIHSLSVGRTHYSLSCVKKIAKTDKSSLSCGRLKFWTFARMQKDNNLCFNARQISQNCTKILKRAARTKKLFSNKVYHVDTSRNENVETNTIRLFSDRFDLSTKSYAGNAQKAHYFCQFFGISTGLTLFSKLDFAYNIVRHN